jgi:hypothetical protein
MRQKITSSIIVHLVCIVVVVIGSLLLISYNLFHTSENKRFSLGELLKPNTLLAMLTYRHNPSITCEPIVSPALPPNIHLTTDIIASRSGKPELITAAKQDDTWEIGIFNLDTGENTPLITDIHFPQEQLVYAYAPIRDKIYYPNCLNNQCFIYEYHLKTQNLSKIPAFDAADKSPLSRISAVFFDEAQSLISYKTSWESSSPRVVINSSGELIHTINEQLRPEKQLLYKGYYPEPGYIRYGDPDRSVDYFYDINGIGLYRKKCSDVPLI